MGRGSSGGGGGGGGNTYGGHGSLQGLIQAMQAAKANSNGAGGNGQGYDDFHAGEGNSSDDFTDNNNPALVKWQQQDDDGKTARYLAKLGKQQTPAQDAEGWSYHQSAMQNMVIDMKLNAPVFAKLNATEFDQYCRANGLTPIYRGWESGASSRTRFETAEASHVGSGRYGEGFYFGSQSTANSYGSIQTVAALSPNARVVDYSKVHDAILKSGAKGAFTKSGVTGSYYDNNIGESQMALKMGYNVIRTDWCYVVLTRDAVVIRK